MRLSLLLLFLFSMISSVIAQKVVHREWGDHMYYHTEFYALEEDTMSLHGPFEIYFQDRVVARGEMNGGNPDGEWNFFYADGSIKSKGKFIDGSKTGTWEYFNFSGKSTGKKDWNNGTPAGEWLAFSNTQKLITKFEFRKGYIQKIETFYPNADTSWVRNFEYDAAGIVGSHRSYYRYAGIFEEYDFRVIKNQLHEKYLDKNGVRDFDLSLIAPLQLSGIYPESMILVDGGYKRFHDSGILWIHEIWDNGILLNPISSQDKFGNKNDQGSFKNGNGSYIRYHRNGEPFSIENFKDGLREGFCEYYAEKERVLARGNFKQGVPHGEWTLYDLDLKPEFNLNFDLPNVSFYETRNSGTTMSSGGYINGKRNGEWIEFDFYGDTTQVLNYSHGNLDGPYRLYRNRSLQLIGLHCNGNRAGTWESKNFFGKTTFKEEHPKSCFYDESFEMYPDFTVQYQSEDNHHLKMALTLPSIPNEIENEKIVEIDSDYFQMSITNGQDGEIVFALQVDDTGLVTSGYPVKYADPARYELAESAVSKIFLAIPPKINGLPLSGTLYVSVNFERL